MHAVCLVWPCVHTHLDVRIPTRQALLEDLLQSHSYKAAHVRLPKLVSSNKNSKSLFILKHPGDLKVDLRQRL